MMEIDEPQEHVQEPEIQHSQTEFINTVSSVSGAGLGVPRLIHDVSGPVDDSQAKRTR